MKRFLAVSFVFVSLLCGISSCHKCYSCNFGNGDVQERCSNKNEGGVEALKLTIVEFEKQGYTCTEK